MTAGCPEVLVLGLGNPLLGDDGAGLALLGELCAVDRWDGRAEFLDGGTQGLALLHRISGRRALVILDAVAAGARPGGVHVIRDWRQFAGRASTAHEGNAAELLCAATLLGDCPERVVIVGIEPLQLRTGIGLSEPVRRALAPARDAAVEAIEEILGLEARQPA
jgi:hydrogenase maturation protease